MSASTSDGPDPGWYADPAGADATFRWWDGSVWTAWLSTDAHAPSPAEPDPEAPNSETTDPDPEGQAEPARPELPPPTGRPVRVYPPGYERRTRRPAAEEPRPASARTPRLIGAAAVLVAVAVIVAVVVYGNQTPADPLAGALVTPSSTSSAEVSGETPQPSGSAAAGQVSFEAATRMVTIDNFRAALPGSPYQNAVTDPEPTAGLLASGFSATAVVQRKYDGTKDWEAWMSVGVLDVAVIQNDDAVKTGRNVFGSYVDLGFPGTKVKLTKVTTSRVTQPGVERGAIVQGNANYQVKGVDSRYDRVSVLVVKLTDGPWVGWMSSRPDKASAATKAALQTSISSIKT